MRLFFCVELDEAVKRALASLIQKLKCTLGNAKWVRPENLHLTVRFLGEVGEDRLGELEALAIEVARMFPPFSLKLGKLSAFPVPRRARVLWVGPVQGAEDFVALVRAVEERVRRLGFEPETKEPRVHVTLARFSHPVDVVRVIRDGPLGTPLPVEVRKLTLMQSILRPEGPIYTPLFRVPLGGG